MSRPHPLPAGRTSQDGIVCFLVDLGYSVQVRLDYTLQLCNAPFKRFGVLIDYEDISTLGLELQERMSLEKYSMKYTSQFNFLSWKGNTSKFKLLNCVWSTLPNLHLLPISSLFVQTEQPWITICFSSLFFTLFTPILTSFSPLTISFQLFPYRCSKT